MSNLDTPGQNGLLLLIGSYTKRITVWLSLVISFLTLASIAGDYSIYFLGRRSALGVVDAFMLRQEANIPTWFAASTLLVCSILLATIALAKKAQGDRYTLHWSVLALIFLCLSLDETISIHEGWDELVRDVLAAQGFLFHAWIILGAAFALTVFLLYLRFLVALPARTRYRFLLAAVIYLGGALGMESFSASVASSDGTRTLLYAMITTVEEVLEMVGVLIFIYALLSYMKSQRVQVHFDDMESARSSRISP